MTTQTRRNSDLPQLQHVHEADRGWRWLGDEGVESSVALTSVTFLRFT